MNTSSLGYVFAVLNMITYGLLPVFAHYFVTTLDPLVFGGATALVGSLPFLFFSNDTKLWYNENIKTSNYDFFVKTNTAAYKGEWVAIAKKKIVAHGADAQKVYAKAKQKEKTANISLAKVPNEHLMVLRFALP